MITLVQYLVPGIFAAGGLTSFFFGFNRLKKFQLINDTPTSKIRSVAMGIAELSGNTYLDKPLKTPKSGQDCVYYKYAIKEYRMHTHTDSKGHTQTSYSWDTIDSGEKRALFYVSDDTGSILINPDKANIDAPLKKLFLAKKGFRLFNKVDNRDFTEIDAHRDPGSGTVGDQKFYEYYISTNERIYALGEVALLKNQHVVQKGKDEKTFIITTKSEKELTSSLKWQTIGCFCLSGLLVAIGLVIFMVLK